MVAAPVLLVLSPGGLETARKIRGRVAGSEIHGLAGRVEGADTDFADIAAHVGHLFAAQRPIIGLCAAGILIRLTAPHLADKRAEPPVLAVAEDGSAVVPLLGGHHGANDLAREVAACLGIAPAITTAGDARFGIALDTPPAGWTLANPEHAKPVMAALLAGSGARISGEAGWLRASALPVSETGEIELVSTHRREPGGETRLIYHPQVLALGVGCERGCEADELIGLVERTLREADLAPASLALVASLDLKADEAAVHALAAHLNVPARFFSRDDLAAENGRLANPSETVLREVGVAGVAEAAALASAGDEGSLLVEKRKSKRATCAVALSPHILDFPSLGRARGRLSVVGLGPGTPDWRSPQARRLLMEATDWVGYGLYLDLAEDLPGQRRRHDFALGEEEARVRHALELAGEGRDVALICSGDPGIYAMASPVFELLDPDGDAPVSDAARRAEIVVAPGISAFQAASALAGAPMGHDFTLISLSDLLTPWPVILDRVRAAAEGDFAVAFYNPASRRRRNQLRDAVAILRDHRPANTPVIVASNLGREGEAARVVTLADFDPATVDMLTLVIVGASTTRAFASGDGKTHVYTPRGYAKKREKSA